MAAKLLDHNNGRFRGNNGDGYEHSKKSKRSTLAKQQLCTCITLFCTKISRRCKTATWNFLISLAHFMEYPAQVFLFVTYIRSFRIQRQKISQTFWQIKYYWRRSMKFESVRIHFLSDVFDLLLSRNFANMATRRYDFSSPYDAFKCCTPINVSALSNHWFSVYNSLLIFFIYLPNLYVYNGLKLVLTTSFRNSQKPDDNYMKIVSNITSSLPYLRLLIEAR